MNVGVTGTRKGVTVRQAAQIADYLSRNVLAIDEFHHGDCIGVDATAAGIASALRIHVVGHPPTNPKARAHFPSDEERPTHDYIQRNHNIVNEVDVLLVVPAEAQERRRSGTWATYRYARRQGVEVVLMPPEEIIR